MPRGSDYLVVECDGYDYYVLFSVFGLLGAFGGVLRSRDREGGRFHCEHIIHFQ